MVIPGKKIYSFMDALNCRVAHTLKVLYLTQDLWEKIK